MWDWNVYAKQIGAILIIDLKEMIQRDSSKTVHGVLSRRQHFIMTM